MEGSIASISRDLPGGGALTLWGITPGDALWNRVIHRRLARVAELWLIPCGAHILALGATIGLFFADTPHAIFPRIALLGGVSVGLVFAQTILLMSRPARSLAPHLQVRLGLAIIGAQAVCLTLLLDAIALAPPGLPSTVGLAAIMLSSGLIGLAVSPVRAVLALYLAGIVVSVIALHGSAPVFAVTGLMLPLFALIVWKLPRGDRAEQERNARAEAERERSARLVHEFETHGRGWFWETDREGRITYLSEGVIRSLDEASPTPRGAQLTDVLQLDSPDPESERTLAFHLSTRTSFTDYAVQTAGEQSDRWWSISGRPVFDEIGQFRGFIGHGGDLTGKRRGDAEISRMALFDALTGLANRHRMRMSLGNTLNPPSGVAQRGALFMLDLDRFKAVNDTLGHQVGDALLKQVGQRLQRSVGDAGLVGRLGGDEFQIIIANEGDRDRLSDLASAVIASLSAPYVVNGTTISIGCSLGIATAPEDGSDSETLIRNADLALYAAKGAGRGIHRFYHAELLAAAQNRRQLEDDLREAFIQGQFHLAYQPVVSTKTERIVGYEALLRWNHPQRGAISPSDFIPIAEECGLIERIGEWALRTACNTAAHWPEDVRVAVNVSPIQFANPNLPNVITSALAQSGLTCGRLELEITEGVFLNENNATDRMFASLKAIGVRLALDDFGTGYSSLGYLKQAPFNKIKIDQSFVRGAVIESSRNAAIIRAIVALADTLGMETTAEGVEVQDEIELIRELGCSHIQGYVYGRPILAEAIAEQLSDGGAVKPSGVRISRAPRMAMLRNAVVETRSNKTVTRIRNITARGVMIDGIANIAAGDMVKIEIFPGETVAARVQWARDRKAGLQFEVPIELDRLIAAVDTILRRVA